MPQIREFKVFRAFLFSFSFVSLNGETEFLLSYFRSNFGSGLDYKNARFTHHKCMVKRQKYLMSSAVQIFDNLPLHNKSAWLG